MDNDVDPVVAAPIEEFGSLYSLEDLFEVSIADACLARLLSIGASRSQLLSIFP